ncbi:Gmad2 immunoglobulin-like domain-containing protein [Zunongwangia pacifica]|uniref:Gmad2 immunoglobulin-like domain-containing protein n=1 Tax=Zunongwangia pacifica TaxID=2911062 RepID=A0A9X2CJI3_9FLAO|nr:Gmad2 immunoglobulin-like domain-containing protein [Zunongwangia pacifica]MCL6217846.1 Gmad2 immunoglobulin-like domain-containing protein [Zunongwangia pacifica]
MKLFGLCTLLILLISFNGMSQTNVMIRAKAKDAKFIGTSVGGAKIMVRNALTKEILAEGITFGSTGNTEKIMKQPKVRYQDLSENNTAGFLAKLDIKSPTFIEVEAYAPINKKQATVKTTTQLWVIPGKDIMGDGVVLEIPGFIIDILSPQTHERIPGGISTEIKVNVVMMCGCPVEEGGLWDASGFEIKAVVEAEGFFKEVALQQTEKSSTFSGNIDLNKGNYTITVYAFDPKTGNSGVDKTNIIIN